MAITIDRLQRIIYVPKGDLVLRQSSPEIRELDLDWFRLELKSIEETEEGIAFPDTHQHTTELTVGGTTFARAITIINNYTVTFEDGQYMVNIVGGNSNLMDVSNFNQVSIRGNNSAGMTSSRAIQDLNTTLTTTNTSIDGLDSDIQNMSSVLGTTNSNISTISSDISDVKGDTTAIVSSIADIFALVNELKQYEAGRWKIDQNTNQMIFYEEDQVTPLIVFNLKDENGNPSSQKIYERVPV